MTLPSRRLGFALFALQLCILLGIAIWADRSAPRESESADIDARGYRFGKSEKERKDFFFDLMKGEKENRAAAEKNKEGVIWNRNHDSYFHQSEWGRILWWSRHNHFPDWQGWLTLDEGLRAHWPLPPDQVVLRDEAPLLPRTRPLDKRPVMIAGPPPPPKPISVFTPAINTIIKPPVTTPLLQPIPKPAIPAQQPLTH